MCSCRHSQEFASPHFNDEDIERNRIKKKTQRKRGILLSAGVSCVDMCAIPNVNNFYIDIIKFNRYLAFERRIHTPSSVQNKTNRPLSRRETEKRERAFSRWRMHLPMHKLFAYNFHCFILNNCCQKLPIRD